MVALPKRISAAQASVAIVFVILWSPCRRSDGRVRVFRSGYGAVTNVLRARRFRLTEPVAHPAHGLDGRRGQTGGDELGAEPREVDVDRAWLHEAVTTPHEVEQLLASEHAPGGGGQRGEEVEFLARQLHGAATHADLESLAIDLELTLAEHGAVGSGAAQPGPAHDGAHTGDDF